MNTTTDFSKLVEPHVVNGKPLTPPYPEGMTKALFGMGCFWGAERKFWQNPAVYVTAVGYSAGSVPFPSYEQVCTGTTGHSEVVLVVYDPTIISYTQLLEIFWQNHDPTQGNRQGNDIGTQYRSGIYTFSDEQMDQAKDSQKFVQEILSEHRLASITTEIKAATTFYFAEPYRQQYLARNPNGYCGLGGLNVDIHLQSMP